MKITNATSAEDYKLCSSFEEVRKTLLEGRYGDRLEKPLAYWALPSDRRLPLAFLGRSVGELLATPFNELTATRGVGQKKISSLVKLLQRATSSEPPAVPFGLDELTDPARRHAEVELTAEREDHGFDPALVSEVLWDRWRDVLSRQYVGGEKLGRLAPTLQSVPTVIWHTPLDQYLNQSLAEIRQLRTHGEKRVAVVLEVVHSVYEVLQRADAHPHLAAVVAPKFILPIECWISQATARTEESSDHEIRNRLTGPLLEQTRCDAGDTVYRLAEGRLGMNSSPLSVRAQARDMGVTRARVYQLLEDCGRIMQVRWPEGKDQLARLSAQFRSGGGSSPAFQLLQATSELFFPDKDFRPSAEGDDGLMDDD